jgi:hypothetical protein
MGGEWMQKSVEGNAAQKFATYINQCLGQRRWTPTMLYVRSNVLSDSGAEVFSARALQKWISGQGLPKIDSVVVMAEALRMPELIDRRVQIEIERFRRN